MIPNIRKFIDTHQLIKRNSTIVIGLSGGPDSVFLLHFLAQLRNEGFFKTLIAAHLDHEWRNDSAVDVDFCRVTAQEHDTPLVAAKISNLATSFKFNGSKEELGRNARRFFFNTVLKKYNADSIALAHHAQDQQETFFIRLLRGATISGLAAIKPKQNNYIRPLLETNKTEIIKYLTANNIAYLTDPSNESDEFLRNRIRNTVIPALKKCDSRFDRKFTHALKNIQETNQFLQDEAQKHLIALSTNIDEHFALDIKHFLELPPIIRERVLLLWLCKEGVKFPVSKGFFSEIIRFLQQHSGGSHNMHKEWKIIKSKGKASILKLFLIM